MIGSPMVFQTAPPQPASKARMTWSPVLVGGADASQNGFGARMPARLIDRSAIAVSPQGAVDAARRALALGDGVHDLLAAVGHVAAREVARVGGLHRERVVDRAPAVEDQARDGAEQLVARDLPGRLDDGVGREDRLRARDRLVGAAAARVGASGRLDAYDPEALDAAVA